jgi:hypothetical protein
MLNLTDFRHTLEAKLQSAGALPCHVGAFSAWLLSQEQELRTCAGEAAAFHGQSRHPHHVAALGYGVAANVLGEPEVKQLAADLVHLGGRTFFTPGRPPRFEIDGIALLGVALGIARTSSDGTWLDRLLDSTLIEVANDPWQFSLANAARLAMGRPATGSILPDLAVALAARGVGKVDDGAIAEAWRLAAAFAPHDSGPARDAVRLAVFDHVRARLAHIAIARMTREDLVSLLANVTRSMRRWTFETDKRTPKSRIARWEIENEYHVQNLLWAVLAPVLADLEDEENLPSLGQKKPRADLGIPSLRTIIEVKFMRNAGQTACAKIIEEVAADASLYLSRSTVYDNIIAVVWDDLAQTEQHAELKAGLEAINGVSAAIILSRPSKMQREID